VSILKTFDRKAKQLEVIILTPEMCRNSPTAISDYKFSMGRTSGPQLKGGRGIGIVSGGELVGLSPQTLDHGQYFFQKGISI